MVAIEETAHVTVQDYASSVRMPGVLVVEISVFLEH